MVENILKSKRKKTNKQTTNNQQLNNLFKLCFSFVIWVCKQSEASKKVCFKFFFKYFGGKLIIVTWEINMAIFFFFQKKRFLLSNFPVHSCFNSLCNNSHKQRSFQTTGLSIIHLRTNLIIITQSLKKRHGHILLRTQMPDLYHLTRSRSNRISTQMRCQWWIQGWMSFLDLGWDILDINNRWRDGREVLLWWRNQRRRKKLFQCTFYDFLFSYSKIWLMIEFDWTII